MLMTLYFLVAYVICGLVWGIVLAFIKTRTIMSATFSSEDVPSMMWMWPISVFFVILHTGPYFDRLGEISPFNWAMNFYLYFVGLFMKNNA